MTGWRARLGADVRVLAAGGYVPATAPRRALKGLLASAVRLVDRAPQPLAPLLRRGADRAEEAERAAFDAAVAERAARLRKEPGGLSPR